MDIQYVIAPTNFEDFRTELLRWFEHQLLSLQPLRKRYTQREEAAHIASSQLLKHAIEFWKNVKIEEPK